MYYVQPTIKTQLIGGVVVKCDSKSVGEIQLRETNPDMIEMLELTDTDFKTAIIKIFKD